MSRPSPLISTHHAEFSTNPGKEPDWYQSFVENLQKQSVKAKGRDDYSAFDQINAIIQGTGSKFSSVEAKVRDMIERTGLKTMLKAQAQLENTTQALNTGTNKLPEIFQDIPELKTFIDNYVEARPGTAVDAVVHDALKIVQIKKKLPEGDDVPEDVKRYISQKISGELSDSAKDQTDNMQLGKVDVSVDKNTVDDPMAILSPHREGH